MKTKLLILIINLLFVLKTYSQNTALHFDGIDDYVEIPKEVGNFDTNQSFTISIWIKPDPKQMELTYEDNDILEKWSQTGEGYPFVLRYFNSTDKEKEGHIWIARYDGDPDNMLNLFSRSKLNDGKWHNIIFLKNRNTVNLYIDGKLEDSNIDRNQYSTINQSPLFIGSRGNKINHFKGSIDELKIWNWANSSILENIYKPLPDNEEKGLVVSYHFSEGKINGNNTGIKTINTQNPLFNGQLNNFELKEYQSNFVNSLEFEKDDDRDFRNKISISMINPFVVENDKKNVFDADISITGTIKSIVGVSKVLINGELADFDANLSIFKKDKKLIFGENKVKIEAFDVNQKSTIMEFSIIRNKEGQSIPNEIPLVDNSKRFALLIGNADYHDEKQKLANPVNDVRLMAKTLANLGFTIIKLENGTKKQIKDSIKVFTQKLAETKETSGLFYYAGHGVQDKKNHNYIVPVEAKMEDEEAMIDECYDIERLLTFLHEANNNLNIIILDACRKNPFARSFRGEASGGLAEVKNPAIGTYIAYATAPGNVADDGRSENGLYTQELVKALETPKQNLEEVFKKTKANVYKLSNKKQLPWDNSFFFGDFYFKLK